MKKNTLLITTILLSIFFTNIAKAYDEDTHFYGTYMMARFAGIRHEVAVKIALSAQWMDESFISDPTSMMFLPLTGVKKRRILHFPSARVVGSANVETQRKILGVNNFGTFETTLIEKFVQYSGYTGNLDNLNFFTQTEEDHAFASQMLMEGLKEGNLMKAAGGLHTLEDSFAHAGTPAEQGHADFWHWPDRAFASVPKYFRMTQAVFTALTAIRTMLPEAALDCGLKMKTASGPSIPNCKMNAKQLAAEYAKQPAVINTISYNVLKDPDYVRTALKDFYDRANKAKYLKMSEATFNSILNTLEINGSKDAYETLEDFMHEVLRRYIMVLKSKSDYEKLDRKEREARANNDLIDINFMLVDMGRLKAGEKLSPDRFLDYMDSYDSDVMLESETDKSTFRGFVHSMAYELLSWNVPVPLSDTHRIELENDGGIVREKEMEIRIRKMQELIYHFYNIKLQLLPNNSKDDVGFAREIRMTPSAEAVIPNNSEITYATFSLKEKNQWDRMIFSYLFPTLKASDLDAMVEAGAKVKLLNRKTEEYSKKREEINNSDSYWATKKTKLLALDYEYRSVVSDFNSAVATVFETIQPIAKTYLSDVVNTHIVPDSDNFIYRKAKQFKAAKDCGDVKPLLQEGKDVWTLESLITSKSTYTNEKR